MILKMARVARRLGEAVIKRALAGAGPVNERRIENFPAGLVHMQPLHQHVLDHACRLRKTVD